MAKQTAKKRKKTRKTAVKTKKNTLFSLKQKKAWEKFKAKLLQKVGLVTVFVLAILTLLTLFIWQVERSHLPNGTQSSWDEDADRLAFVQAIIPTAQRLQRQYGIYASVSMAQAMLESDYGQSGLAADYNNLFGVKTDASDPDGADLVTAEFVNGEWIEITDRFKVYESWAASMEAHALLLVNGTTWDPDFYQDVTQGLTPVDQARGLQSAGYATDPDYADKLIAMMEQWDLYQYNQPEQSQETTTESNQD